MGRHDREHGKVLDAIGTLVVGALMLCAARDAFAAPLPRTRPILDFTPGDRVLCLVDSSEGVTAERNPLAAAIAPAIARLGLQVRWHDIAQSGLPSLQALEGVRAVVTGFLDGAMAGAARYPEFVRTVVARGVRFVIIGNYGAWQEGGPDGPFVASEIVNSAFAALGVRYRARWTSDPSLFTVEVADPAIGPARDLRPDAIRHFYQFDAIRDDVRVLVAARRTDAPPGHERPSAPVFTSATGAMVLQRYLSPSDLLQDAGAFRFDAGAFLALALAYTPRDPGTLLVLHDPDTDASREAMKTLRAASSYTGLPMVGVSLASVSRLRPMDLAAHRGVVLAFDQVRAPAGQYLADLVGAFVRLGGRVASILPVSDPDLARILGHGRPETGTANATGLVLREGLFPGTSGLRAGPGSVRWTATRGRPGPGCRVLADSEDAAGAVPLWWRCRVGHGEVSALNAVEFADRAFLGFVIQAVLDAAGTWAMPVLASAVEFVDDCPLPMADRVIPGVGRPDVEFYSNDFYGMLLEARERLGMRPTFLAVFSYGDEVRGPFGPPFAGTTAERALGLARRIVADDFPVGLHGMNHMSPTLSGGVSRPFDAAGLDEWFASARDAFREVFGPENGPVVFVPPNNFVDAAGKRALVQALPDLRVLSSVFAGSEVETVQDFAVDPDLPGVVDFPRTWAGHVLAGEALVQMLNGLLALSVSSHFIHPDDLLDPERSGGRPWEALRRGFLEGAAEVRRRFPFLRERTVEQAAEDVRRVVSRKLRVIPLGCPTHPPPAACPSPSRPPSPCPPGGTGGLRVERASGLVAPDVLLVRFPTGCEPRLIEGGSLVSSDPGSGRHHVRMEARVLEMECAQSPSETRRDP